MSDEIKVTSEAIPIARYQSASVDASVIARFASKVRGLKDQVKTLTTERDGYKSTADQLTGERDALRIKADTSLTAKELDRLRATLREFKHRQAFDKIASGAGIRPDALADAWELAKVQPEADEPDEGTLGEVVTGLKSSKAYLFTGDAAASAGESSASPSPKPAPGSGRGTPPIGGAPIFSIELAKNDPAYVMRNYDAYTAAAKAGQLK